MCSKIPDTGFIVHSVPGMEQLKILLYLICILNFGCNTAVLWYGITVHKIILVLKKDSNIYSVLSLSHSENHGASQNAFRTMLELKHMNRYLCSDVMHKTNIIDHFRIAQVFPLKLMFLILSFILKAIFAISLQLFLVILDLNAVYEVGYL